MRGIYRQIFKIAFSSVTAGGICYENISELTGLYLFSMRFFSNGCIFGSEATRCSSNIRSILEIYRIEYRRKCFFRFLSVRTKLKMAVYPHGVLPSQHNLFGVFIQKYIVQNIYLMFNYSGFIGGKI